MLNQFFPPKISSYLFSKWWWVFLCLSIFIGYVVIRIFFIYPFDRLINIVLAIATLLGGGGVALLGWSFNEYRQDVKKRIKADFETKLALEAQDEGKITIFLDHSVEDKKLAEQLKNRLTDKAKDFHIIVLNIMDMATLNDSFESSKVVLTIYNKCPKEWFATRLRYYKNRKARLKNQGKPAPKLAMFTSAKQKPIEDLGLEFTQIHCAQQIDSCQELDLFITSIKGN